MKSTNDTPLPDDVHRIQQHEDMKDRLRKDVHQEVQDSADSRTSEEKSKVAAVADQMKSKAIGEIGRTEAEPRARQEIHGDREGSRFPVLPGVFADRNGDCSFHDGRASLQRFQAVFGYGHRSASGAVPRTAV